MSAESDAFFRIFGMLSSTCETCTHALPSAAYPMVYCPVKFNPVNAYDRCQAYAQKDKA